MGSFICKQPNGLLCRFSTVVDCPTNYNMTEKDYVELKMMMAKEEAEFNLSQPNFFLPFETIQQRFWNSNMQGREFNKILNKMAEPVTPETETNIST